MDVFHREHQHEVSGAIVVPVGQGDCGAVADVDTGLRAGRAGLEQGASVECRSIVGANVAKELHGAVGPTNQQVLLAVVVKVRNPRKRAHASAGRYDQVGTVGLHVAEVRKLGGRCASAVKIDSDLAVEAAATFANEEVLQTVAIEVRETGNRIARDRQVSTAGQDDLLWSQVQKSLPARSMGSERRSMRPTRRPRESRTSWLVFAWQDTFGLEIENSLQSNQIFQRPQ